jgi:hypothetical protein
VQQSRFFDASTRGPAGKKDMTSTGLDAMFQMARNEQKTQQDAQAYRDRALRARGGHGGGPTMTEKYDTAIKGKPNPFLNQKTGKPTTWTEWLTGGRSKGEL